MLKRIVLGLFLVFGAMGASFADYAASVEYVHSAVKKQWNLDIPMTEGVGKYAANMEYLLKVVDKANETLTEGQKTTNYAADPKFATKYIADLIATNDAVSRLISPYYTFSVITTPDTKNFQFALMAEGEFWIDWGDGSAPERVVRESVARQWYRHQYASANSYKIRLAGRATGYSTVLEAAITFEENKNVAELEGDLGKVFPRLEDGSMPIFFWTFYRCSNLKSVPETLFASVQGEPVQLIFGYTFSESGLTSIPENLFASVQGAPAARMFEGTFQGCSGLTGSIPENLFASMQGAPAKQMFNRTFENCSGLTGQIPENLFAGIQGVPAENMFAYTFEGCGGLTGPIPGNLFAGISGVPAERMFEATFQGCSGLTGPIPGNLFAGISGVPARYMFSRSFSDCAGLTSISENLFAGISGAGASNMFNETFLNCTSLTGDSAKIDGKYLYEVWETKAWGENMYKNCTGLTDYEYIPILWGGLGKERMPEPTFFVTTTPDTQKFEFLLIPAGEFWVDWGDGTSPEKIVKESVGMQQYTHTYSKAGQYKISFAGQATEYGDITSDNPSDEDFIKGGTISLTNISGVEGTLSKLFPKMSDGTMPVFMATFAMNPSLTSVPDTLFAGLEGQPREYMFFNTFLGCSGLTSVPENLFAGIRGIPTEGLFAGTFMQSGLTSVPENLFAGIQGAPATFVFGSTFSECDKLTRIPDNLFAGISGAPAVGMFNRTFERCTGLTGIPEKLFAGIKGAPAETMFSGAFWGCTGLTGESAKIDGKYLYDIWSEGTGYGTDMYAGGTGLTDYPYIPKEWGGLGQQRMPEATFFVNTTPDTQNFQFALGAAGEFWVDWGDGSMPEKISKESVGLQQYSHAYSKAGQYKISFAGQATQYGVVNSEQEIMNGMSISFMENQNVATVEGTLTKIFPKLSNGSIPSFVMLFGMNQNLTSIPSTLFEGLEGSLPKFMFAMSFTGTAISEIPAALFAGVKGEPTDGLFYGTFGECKNLTSIPAGLFANITGTPKMGLFMATFGATAITSIPENLFAGIKGAPADNMFGSTFAGCESLDSIPANLFAGISGAPAEYMFNGLFDGCVGLTSVPEGLFAGISGAPAKNMFSKVFNGCTGLVSVPENLFAGISGNPADSMFNQAFNGCTSLTGNSLKNSEGKFLYEVWGECTNCANDMYKNCNKLSDFVNIPTVWGGLGGFVPKFFVDLDLMSGKSFKLDIGAAGEFWIDWGDGTPFEKIVKTSTGVQTYSHTYDTYKSDVTFAFGGEATDYSTDVTVPAVRFANNQNIKSISGSLGQIFPKLESGKMPRFRETFAKFGKKDGSYEFTIPETLFDGLEGAPVEGMFYRTFADSFFSGGISADLFAGIKGAPAKNMFNGTFSGTDLTGAIPADLFAGISGAPAEGMFNSTFSNADFDGLIPENLFAGIKGAPAASMFNNTFSACLSLTGSIPANLFAGISGAPKAAMFKDTFKSCVNLSGEIPESLFAGISGAPASEMYRGTFYSCKGLTGAIPADLFAGINGAAADNMFYGTFYSCENLTGSIPENLFAGISGSPKISMFSDTFSGCTGLSGQIPENLFAGISGAPASDMFHGTFDGCSGLTGAIPANLFAGISGAPAESMFSLTFNGCTGLNGTVPGGLFAGIQGRPATSMFSSTFSGCVGLTGIEDGLFNGISGAEKEFMFASTFSGCNGLAGDSAKINGQYIYDIWSDCTNCGRNMYKSCTALNDYPYIPVVWGGLGGEQVIEPTFFINTTSDTKDFSFGLNAAGEFWVDWGDGSSPEKLVRESANDSQYVLSHTYSVPGQYKIGFSSRVTEYSSSDTVPAIRFEDNLSIESLEGDLTTVFPVLADGTVPRFRLAFKGCKNLKSISADLFAGLNTAPVTNMFDSTFLGCTSLEEIPDNLFAGISGAAADNMFYATFRDCTSLTGESAKINGQYLYDIWSDCSGCGEGMYLNCTGLSDFEQIPTSWKSLPW